MFKSLKNSLIDFILPQKLFKKLSRMFLRYKLFQQNSEHITLTTSDAQSLFISTSSGENHCQTREKSSMKSFPPVERQNHERLESVMRVGKSASMMELING